MTQNAVHLDCIGLNCPMPIIKLTKKILEIASGECINIVAADPAFHLDLKIWAKKHGHTIVEFDENDDIQHALVQKK